MNNKNLQEVKSASIDFILSLGIHGDGALYKTTDGKYRSERYSDYLKSVESGVVAKEFLKIQDREHLAKVMPDFARNIERDLDFIVGWVEASESWKEE